MKHLELSVLIKSFSNWYSINIIKPRQVAGFFVYRHLVIFGKVHDLRKTFSTRLYFLTGQEFTLCRALGHTDTSMTMQYTNLDKVELSRSFPDIVAMKNNGIDGKNPLRVPNQGYLELYSNFGFMHVT